MQQPFIPLFIWLDVPTKTSIYETYYYASGKGYDIHKASVPGHCFTHQQVVGQDLVMNINIPIFQISLIHRIMNLKSNNNFYIV